MGIYYFGGNVASANSLKFAQQSFERIFKIKIDKKEILDYDPKFLDYLEKTNQGYLIKLKDGSYVVKFYWGNLGFHVFSSFDKNKAKIFTAKKGVSVVESLIYYTEMKKRTITDTNSLKIVVDNIIVSPDILI